MKNQKSKVKNQKEIKISDKVKPQRLDVYLSDKLSLSRAQVQKLIQKKYILINQKETKASYKLKGGEKISIEFPKPEKLKLEPENIPLQILYQDKDFVVISKPKGIVVHPGAGVKKGTLVSGLLHHCKDLSSIGGVLRPGIVHRLDKETSGVLIVAKTNSAHLNLSSQFSQRKIKKIYWALVHGDIKENQGKIILPIGRHLKNRKKMAVVPRGRTAQTNWKVLKRYKDYTLLELQLLTGRTHQIRVHLNHIGHPVAGDPTYGKRKNLWGLKTQFLHAKTIGFHHPKTGKYMEFSADLSEALIEILEKLK